MVKCDVPLVVLDMDGVLVKERSSWRSVHHRLGTDNEESFSAYINGEIDDLEFMRRDIELWTGSDPKLDSERIRTILEESTRMKGFPDAIYRLKESGCDVFIISGGLDLLAEVLSTESAMDGFFANGLEFGPDGRPTGKGILKVPLKDKGSIIRESLVKGGRYHPVISVGDSIVDITMFEHSDLSIAFRPESEEVADSADIVIDNGDLFDVTDAILTWLRDLRNNLL
jgi:phosphoserine phosphatase